MTRTVWSKTLPLWTLCACAVLWSLPPITHGRVRGPSEISLRPPPGLRSRSIGLPWRGELQRGLRVRESAHLRYVPEYQSNGRFYGSWQLVQLIERAARRVAVRVPGSRLSIGELSGKLGGDIDGHHSHESGRDADIGFFMTRADGRPYAGLSFAQFDAQGRGLAPNGGLRFDDTRNWELVAKLVDDADARVQYIFVANALRQRLLREAARRNAPAELIARAASVLVEPAHGNPHRSHFHVRIYCALSDRPGCMDVAPYWAWYPRDPTPARLRPAASLALRTPFGAEARSPKNESKRARFEAD